MENALIEVKKINLDLLFSGEITKNILAEIHKKVNGFEPDVTTGKGRKEIASMAFKVARSKTLLDDLGKERTKEWKAKAKKVDEVRKEIRDDLDALKAEIRQPLVEWEEAEATRKAEEARIEQERVDGIRKKIAAIQHNVIALPSMSSEEINVLLSQVFDTEVTEEAYQEYYLEAEAVKKETVETIKSALDAQREHEAAEEQRKEEAAKLEAQRKEQEAERKRIQAEKEKQEEEFRKKQAELDATERRLQAEKDRIEADKRAEAEAKEKAEREEKERVEAEKREAAEKKRQEALRPDKEKFNTYVQSHNEIAMPTFKAQAVCDLANDFEAELDRLVDKYINKAESL